MFRFKKVNISLAGILFAIAASVAYAQTAPAPAGAQGRASERPHLEPPVPTGPPNNSAPNPYRTITGWYQWPEGREKGSMPAIAIDKGDHLWVIERCGIKGFVPTACADSKLDPIFEWDSNGKLVRNWGGGMFVFPHNIAVDADGNVWITDAEAKDGRGLQVIKFSPDGKVLMRLGTAGVAGRDRSHFEQPTAIAIAPNGDIFVGEGHGGDRGDRIVKFTKDGKYIKEWGKKGAGPGEFDIVHAMTFDNRGRLLVADRNNNRIQIFDQEGKFIQQFTQFSRPSGVAVDKNDLIYVADSESESVSQNHWGWKRGIRVGSLKDGKVLAFIPDPVDIAPTTNSAEGIVVDSKGAIYGAEMVPNDVKKYVKDSSK
jgi:hypothetical protein